MMAQPMQTFRVQEWEDTMGQVEWIELLRWVPRAPQGESDPDDRVPGLQEVAVASADEGYRPSSAP